MDDGSVAIGWPKRVDHLITKFSIRVDASQALFHATVHACVARMKRIGELPGQRNENSNWWCEDPFRMRDTGNSHGRNLLLRSKSNRGPSWWPGHNFRHKRHRQSCRYRSSRRQCGGTAQRQNCGDSQDEWWRGNSVKSQWNGWQNLRVARNSHFVWKR